MKVAIIGSGAMGSVYGGILAEAGNEVYLIDVFEEHINKINKNGLCIVDNSGDRYIKNIYATSKPENVGIVDLAIIFVKSTITYIGVKQNINVIGEDTIVLTLQNGLGNIEKINEYVDLEQIIVGTSANGASMIEPGKVNHAGNGGTIIGELNGNITERIQELKLLLDLDKLGPCSISDNVMGLIWDKLLVNAGINPLTALTGLKNGELLNHVESIEIMESLIDEGVKVARAAGVKISYEDSENCKNVCKATANNISSMLSDIKNKRKTEILNINGAIVDKGKEYNISTPFNEIMTNLIILKENGY